MMGKGFKELAMHYFEEVANDPERKNPEQLRAYADNFAEDVWRWMRARLDFKEGYDEDDRK